MSGFTYGHHAYYSKDNDNKKSFLKEDRAAKSARACFGKSSREQKRMLEEVHARQEDEHFDRLALTKKEYQRLVKEEEFRKSMGWAPRWKLK